MVRWCFISEAYCVIHKFTFQVNLYNKAVKKAKNYKGKVLPFKKFVNSLTNEGLMMEG